MSRFFKIDHPSTGMLVRRARRQAMSEISERYARLSGAFAEKVADVRPDRWERPSPCEGWSARDVVDHVVQTHGMFLRLVGRELGSTPSVDDDPVAAFDAARKVVQADLDDPQRAAETFEGQMGTMSFEDAIDRFLCFDLVVHGWDLARAAGLDEHIDPDDVQRVLAAAPAFGDALRGPGVCGPELTPPPGADEQTRMLAFLGRRSWA
jgi:uncharacterized protein (TIGR03086 family)